MDTTCLRQCQHDAIETVNERYGNVLTNETNLSLCTGAGKTRIIQTLCLSHSRIILVFPWLALLTQFWKDIRNPLTNRKDCYYLATEGTITDIPRLSASCNEIYEKTIVILTTYASAPELYASFDDETQFDLIIHDEAHHIKATQYSNAFDNVRENFTHTVNLSATLSCEPSDIHYKYSLLRGIKDKVVRDFRANVFICTSEERTRTSVIIEIVKQLILAHNHVKLLIYTREAETDDDDSSSVRTFMTAHSEALTKEGWWVRGINSDTIKDKDILLREFQKDRKVSILVSCKTLSEGVDLRNANCMMAWDATKSTVDNIQRIGRVLRKYKDADGNDLDEDLQTRSTIMIPVFLDYDKYTALGGDRKKIHDALCEEIGQNVNGNFMPFISVMAALKSELADEDEELMDQLLNYPPRVKVGKGIADCIGKKLKKKPCDILDEAAQVIEDNDEDVDEMFDDEELSDDEEECLTFANRVRQGEWDEEEAEDVANAIAKSQNIQLVITEGDEVSRFGEEGQQLFVEKKGDTYKALSNSKKATEAAKKHFKDRMHVSFSGECEIMIGLNGDDCIDGENNFVMRELTMEVDGDRNWRKRHQKRNLFFQQNGREPISSAKNTDGTPNVEERSIARWVVRQRMEKIMFDEGNKSQKKQERINILNDQEQTPGWLWGCLNENRWTENHRKRNIFFQQYGREPSTHVRKTGYTLNKEECSIANWVVGQRKAKKKFDNGERYARITIERINILNDQEQTPGWKWSVDISKAQFKLKWLENHQKRNLFFHQYDIEPSVYAHNSDFTPNKYIRSITQWIKDQRKAKKKFDKGRTKPGITQERIDILNDPKQTPGWKWEDDLEHKWLENHQKRNLFFHQYDIEPSVYAHNSDFTPNKYIRSIAQWIKDQRKAKKKFDKGRTKPGITQERIDILNDPLQTPGWKWVASKDKQIIPSPPPQNTIVKVKRRRPVIKPKEHTDAEKKALRREQVKNQMTEYHKRFKRMKHENFSEYMYDNPQEWEEYHKVADEHDDRDSEEQKPINVINSKFLRRYKNGSQYKGIDLGCGQDRLRHTEGVDKLSWEAVDVVAVNDTVTVADMGALPYGDEVFDFGAMIRSLWAEDREKVLAEAYRVLKLGGRLFICEAWGKWHKVDGLRLTDLVEQAGFVVKQILGDGQEEGGEYGCWFYLECVKE